jgi:hypothetical protein
MSEKFGPTKLDPKIVASSDALFNKPLPGRPAYLKAVKCMNCGCQFSSESTEPQLCHFCEVAIAAKAPWNKDEISK